MAEMSLLPTSHLRSDDPEAGTPEAGGSGPGDHEGKPHVHRITGEFADPRLTAEFGPMAFRSMYPLHAAGMGLMCVGGVAFTVVERDIPGAAVTGALVVVLGALGLWARVAVHQWQDTKKASRVRGVGLDDHRRGRESPRAHRHSGHGGVLLNGRLPDGHPRHPLVAACFAVGNASHGMEFWHATSLVGTALVALMVEAIACDFKLATTLAIGELVPMAVGAHFAHLIAHHSFMQSYYIKESRDRLDFRDQMASHREHRACARPAVLRETGHSDHSSASAPTAAPAASTTSNKSAPAAVRFAPGTRGGTGTTQPSTVAPEAQPSGPQEVPVRAATRERYPSC